MTLINNRIFAVHEISVGDLLGWEGKWSLVIALGAPETFSGERLVTAYWLGTGKMFYYRGGNHAPPWTLYKADE